MTAPPPTRPWSKKKRTWAAALAAMIIAYLAGIVPVLYAVGRGWLDDSTVETYFKPVEMPFRWWNEIGMWAYDSGLRHKNAASD